VARRLLSSAQDVSGGGLAVALAECVVWGRVGAELQLPVGQSPSVVLFGETPGRAVVSLPAGRLDELARLAAYLRVPLRRLGLVGGDRLRIRLVGVGATGAAEERGAGVADELDQPLRELERAWRQALPRALGEAS
ncbi:MAG: AIR synthase-related protein, partial [Chloroflexota bacterium]|nr:AIR synthase-related protein [Chloroflexota bacterium]